jgi:amino acid transporter
MTDQGSGIGDQGSGAAPKKRKWIAIVLGVLFVFGMLAVGCVVVAVSFFRQNMEFTENITEDNAKNEFDAVYTRFPGSSR